jgi:hypothetical protein
LGLCELNENIYILYLARSGSDLLTRLDLCWPFYGCWIFSHLFGALTQLFTWETVAWLGRILLDVNYLGRFSFGPTFSHPKMDDFCGHLFRSLQQSPVGGEWVVGT